MKRSQTILAISVVVCAHNEERYVDRCLPSLLRALRGFSFEILFVADRCSDGTVDRARRYPVTIMEKAWRKWTNSYAESLQLGLSRAKGKFTGIVDVDVIVPENMFHDLGQRLGGRVASAAAAIATYPDTFLNRLMNAWEKTYRLAPLGREPYGAARLILSEALDNVGGFRDVPTPDTDLDIRFAELGYDSVSVPSVRVYHIRHVSLRSMINGQIVNGRGRCALGLGFVRTFGQAVFRVRPFLIGGWLMEWARTSGKESR